jgi:hypothetical protein
LTVSVAAALVAVPNVLVNIARYLFPFCGLDVVNVSVVEVAPTTLLNVVPPFVLTCHCTVGAGYPLAAAVKVALLPAVTDWLAGCVVIAGGIGLAGMDGPLHPARTNARPANRKNPATKRKCDKSDLIEGPF